MTAVLTPAPKAQFLTNNGAPLVGGKLYSYAAGTTTPLATYTTYAGTIANTNPVILDSRGEANVWLTSGVLYKLALYDADNALIWTVDNVSSINDGLFSGPVSGTTATFSGALTAASGAFTGNVQIASLNGGAISLRNYVINGNMGIFQRGATAVTTAGAYGPPDRWRNDAIGNTFSTTQGSFVSGDTLYDTGGAQYFTQIAVTSVANAANNTVISQFIEDVRLLAGKTVTVSFWAKAASGTPSIGLEIAQNFGTGGSPSSNVFGTGQAQALTTTWTQYSKTFTVPSINGKTIGTTANTSYTFLNFWLDAGTNFNTRSGSIGQASKTVSIAQVQLEVGPVATPFEQRPYGMELALCQRYYQIVTHGMSANVTTANSYVSVVASKVELRATPTATYINTQTTASFPSSAGTYSMTGTYGGSASKNANATAVGYYVDTCSLVSEL